jgi:hypothetical protein
VSLTTCRLSICKYSCVFAPQQLIYMFKSDVIIDLLLCGEFTAYAVKAELIGSIVNHGLIIFECRSLTRLEATIDADLCIILVSISLFLFLQLFHLNDLVNQVNRDFLVLLLIVLLDVAS